MTESERKLIDLVKELSEKVDDLIKWKESKERQQISLPLDEASKRIINDI